MDPGFYKTYFDLEKDNWWFKVRRNMIFRLLERYNIGRNDRILDYGCGSGFLVGQLQNQGYDAYGVDISKEAIDFGISRGVKSLSLEDEVNANFANNYFDAILAMDVIEHIEDDQSALEKLERLLRPGGYLIITVPAYQWMWGVQDEAAHHFRRYTTESVLALVRNSRASLSIIRSTYFNTFLFGPIAVVRLLSRMFSLKSRESDFDLSSSFLNKILYGIFNLEAKLLRVINFPFGVSILAILRKS